jgi:hypothetical protein
VKITREAFSELFGVHLPTESPSAWVKGTRYEFIAGNVEIEELERLLGGGQWQGINSQQTKAILPRAALP